MLLFLSKGWKDEWGGHNELGHINEKNQLANLVKETKSL